MFIYTTNNIRVFYLNKFFSFRKNECQCIKTNLGDCKNLAAPSFAKDKSSICRMYTLSKIVFRVNFVINIFSIYISQPIIVSVYRVKECSSTNTSARNNLLSL